MVVSSLAAIGDMTAVESSSNVTIRPFAASIPAWRVVISAAESDRRSLNLATILRSDDSLVCVMLVW